MIQKNFPITSISEVNPHIIRIRLNAPEIAASTLPGQFINIKIDETTVPLLRRPFSVHYVENEEIEIVVGVTGVGTNKLTKKRIGDLLDVLGPLGKPFNIDVNEEISILVGGGLGAAPLPMITRELEKIGKKLITFIGARSKIFLLKKYMKNIQCATDDGTLGYKGNVVDLLQNYFLSSNTTHKIYACGPTPMIQALSNLVGKYNIPCEVSLETAMACGFGICQGCAVQMKTGEKKYCLVCSDGPVFNIKDINI